jgi:cytochrome P450
MQAKLRRQLRVSYAEAHKQERQPTVSEIVQSAAPYLEAFIEESLRCTKTLSVMIREATVDTTIMGHQIPKGTTVMLMGRGASITKPAIEFPDEVRSKSSLLSRERVPSWNSEDVAQFNPERWLKTKTEAGGPGEFGNLEYDGQAGPMLAFGGGMRGCFGKRLAYLELRMSLVLLVWNFDFASCGSELSSYEGYDVFTTTPRQCFVKLKKTTL